MLLKRLALMAIFTCCLTSLFAQQATIKHIVTRGETLTSIAERYDTSIDKIVKLNPEAEQFIFTGMELTVPITLTTRSREEMTSCTCDTREENKNKVWGGICGEVVFGDIYGEWWTLSASIGPKLFLFNSAAYINPRIGYICSFGYDYDGWYGGYDSYDNYHFFEIPIEMGYTLASRDKKWAFIPFYSFNLNFGGGEGIVGADTRFGVRFRLHGFNISSSFHVALNDSQIDYFGETYVDFGIGYGF